MNFPYREFLLPERTKRTIREFGHPPRTVSPLAKSRLIATSSLHSASRNRSDHVRLSLPLSPPLALSISLPLFPLLPPPPPYHPLLLSLLFRRLPLLLFLFIRVSLFSCAFLPPSVSKVQFFPLLGGLVSYWLL